MPLRIKPMTRRPTARELGRAWMSALIVASAFLAFACNAHQGEPSSAGMKREVPSPTPAKAASSALPSADSGPQDKDGGAEDIAALLQDEVGEAENRLADTRRELAQTKAQWEACRSGIRPPQTGGWGVDASYIAQLVECDTLRNRAVQLESTLRVREVELSFARTASEPGGLEKLAQKARQLGILQAGRAVEREAWGRFLAQERATYAQYYDSIGRNPYPTPPVGPIGMNKPRPRE